MNDSWKASRVCVWEAVAARRVRPTVATVKAASEALSANGGYSVAAVPDSAMICVLIPLFPATDILANLIQSPTRKPCAAQVEAPTVAVTPVPVIVMLVNSVLVLETAAVQILRRIGANKS